MASPAMSTDLQNRSLRTLTAQEISVGSILLGDAWTILMTRVSGLDTRVEAIPTDVKLKALVVQIQCAMVLRVLNNPDGKLSETSDDYTYRLDAAVSTGALYASDAEVGLLAAGDSVSDGAFTIKPYGTTAAQPDTWYTVGSAAI